MASDARLVAGRHEQGLARFLQRHRRERFLSGLKAGGASREEVLRRLPHFTDLDARYGRPAPSGSGWEEVGLVTDALTDLGAPLTVYVVSELATADGRFMPLEEALRTVLSQSAGLSCRAFPVRWRCSRGRRRAIGSCWCGMGRGRRMPPGRD